MMIAPTPSQALADNLPLPQKPGFKRHWDRLAGSSLSLMLAELSQQHPGPVMVATPDMHMANRLAREIKFFADQPCQVLIFPDWETLPYDQFSPYQDIISQRLLTLYQLPTLPAGIILVPITTLMHRVIPRGFIEQHSFALKTGQLIEPLAFTERLQSNGYTAVNQVMAHGEYARRGAIIDLYPMGSQVPYRIDLFDNEVDSIRTFDPETQRSLATVAAVELLPAHEFPLSPNDIEQFRQAWRATFPGDPTQCPIYQSLSQGQSAAGIEYYLPLFFDTLNTLFDYLPPSTLTVQIGDLQPAISEFWQQIHSRFDNLGVDPDRPLLPPQQLFLAENQIFAQFNHFKLLQLETGCSTHKQAQAPLSTRLLPDLSTDHLSKTPLAKLVNFVHEYPGRILLTVESTGRREMLLELLKSRNITPTHCADWSSFLQTDAKITITIAPLDAGFCLQSPEIAVISESELFGEQVMQRRLRKQQVRDPATIISDLTELQIGANVVHMDHGVGRYCGLKVIDSGEVSGEYLQLEYANEDKLLVPIAQLQLISRYSGGEETQGILNQLGSKKWQRAKRKAVEKIRDVAAEILDIYARRQATKGHAFSPPSANYQQFAASFPFEETPDQQQAITAVIADMTASKPMDRLICGDVGFGKTEVAIRAAFLAVEDHQQVAILVPTTILAEQHDQTFKDRFAEWPVRVEALSRFRTTKEANQITQDLASGKVDIIIGTHKLLQATIKFKQLGLLIIDEEHRFGVTQKEKIKSYRAQVDILTLTATPIPRTLNLSMAKIRDMSIIASPPPKRLAVKTFVLEERNDIIKEAINREILRGGQVYFLHNTVQTIHTTAERLQDLVPNAKIVIGHGQMVKHALEKVMIDFYHQRFNVLLCTTIIESGIDIPTANTILIHRADRFGLAQLHQLRGRVGRSHHQAYAYLLTPEKSAMTRDAKKRLDAIASLEDLGAGFNLASHDLEIRGAGELLGDEQSGHIQTIGFSLYMDLLDQAVKALQSGEQIDLDTPVFHSTDINFHVSSLIPEFYVPDVSMRLTLYKRLSSVENQQQLQELQVEFIDRFGLLPEPCQNLFSQTKLKLLASQLGISKINAGKDRGKIVFSSKPNIDVNKLVALIQNNPSTYRMVGQNNLQFTLPTLSIAKRYGFVEQLLKSL